MFGGFRQISNNIGSNAIEIKGGILKGNSVNVANGAYVGSSNGYNSTTVTLRGAYESILISRANGDTSKLHGAVSVNGTELSGNKVAVGA